jgi:hypothetical protein
MIARHGARLTLATLLVTAAASLSCSQPGGEFAGIPWIENDYEAALALATEKDLPIFVESWAPW